MAGTRRLGTKVPREPGFPTGNGWEAGNRWDTGTDSFLLVLMDFINTLDSQVPFNSGGDDEEEASDLQKGLEDLLAMLAAYTKTMGSACASLRPQEPRIKRMQRLYAGLLWALLLNRNSEI